jgi:hypothetical protein
MSRNCRHISVTVQPRPRHRPGRILDRGRLEPRAGRIRIVFVADEIPTELRRVVEFLNGEMTPAEVIGIEINQYVGEGMKTLVPRVVGATAEAQQRKGHTSSARRWDEKSFAPTPPVA